MSLAKKCDRCGKLYEHYPTDDNLGNGEPHNGIKKVYVDIKNAVLAASRPMDLCPECLRNFNLFMARLPLEEENYDAKVNGDAEKQIQNP